MSRLGAHIVYFAHAAHHTFYHVPPLKPGEEPTEKHVKVEGSIHHPDLREFAGLVTREHPDGTRDLVIFPPGKNPTHVEAVPEGSEPGTFHLVEETGGTDVVRLPLKTAG